MTAHQELVDLEHRGWQALCAPAPDVRAHYAPLLEPDVLMLLPGGTVVRDADTALRLMSGEPWASYALHDVDVVLPAPGAGLVTYRAVGTRPGGVAYTALMSSLYRWRDARWRLAFHQQTPV